MLTLDGSSRSGRKVLFYLVNQSVNGVTFTSQIILHTVNDQRTAVARDTVEHFFPAQPKCSNDTLIECSFRVVRPKPPGKRKAQVSRLAARLAPSIDAGDMVGHKIIGSLLEDLALNSSNDRLVGLQMTSWLIELQPAAGFLLHKQKAACLLYTSDAADE